jgi:hypothetical protein
MLFYCHRAIFYGLTEFNVDMHVLVSKRGGGGCVTENWSFITGSVLRYLSG